MIRVRATLSADPAVLAAGALFAVLSVGHLVAQLVGAGGTARITQCLLMPVLAAVVWFATAGAPRARLVRLVLVALAFSWLGDSVPALFSGDARFLVMVGLFLCAQVVYAVAFWPSRRRSVLRRPALVWYVLAFGALLVSCAPGAGGLLVPVIGYGLCLALMAVLATGVNRLVAVGGALFFVSDGLIALDAFAKWYDPPVPGFWVMLTYLSAQALIAAGVSRASRNRSPSVV
ncbi:lysoplasmalogenase [Umezawaea sp. Da 62-37]|uniref:lysoplasmalogenase n=1 Tax=Umezawaea sp. Da 62-37 TaxID=3075927 RepID=UPI0028F6F7D2|nr:lysoplasmalogenase [Umezawaea sp. Da 62-37]WNV87894.1 lysoplasmalogenase [Umezawaea sp. Da 62-37]